MLRFLSVMAVLAVSIGAAHAEDVGLTVQSAETGVDINGQPSVHVALDAPSAERFAQFTTSRVGSQIFAYVADRLILAPVLQSPITDGHLQISGGGEFDFETAKMLAEYLEDDGGLSVSDEER